MPPPKEPSEPSYLESPRPPMFQRFRRRGMKAKRILWLTKEMIATHSLIRRHILGLPCVLFLNGYPGVGKLTIARAVHSDLGNSRLVDNNLLVELAEAIEPTPGPKNEAIRAAIRKAAFDGLKAVTNDIITVILTACTLSDRLADLDRFAEFVDVARVRGVPFVSVNLDCDSQTNIKRVGSEERLHDKSKLMDVQVLLDTRNKYKLLDPKVCITQTRDVEIYHKDLDTTRLTVEESSTAVMDFLTQCGVAHKRQDVRHLAVVRGNS
jgi:predicted kinase